MKLSFRISCGNFIKQKWFDNAVLTFIALNCITLAMERPNIPPDSNERMFLGTANYVFTVVFALEMFVKVSLPLTFLFFQLRFTTAPRTTAENRAFPSLTEMSTLFYFALHRLQVVAAGMFYGTEPYFKSGWNIMDGLLVIVSIIDLLMSLISESSPKIFGILRVCYGAFVLYMNVRYKYHYITVGIGTAT